jgi:3-hydroxy-9,10-secoandrosta-1,3,5(10)-triene-9,17-dione monooxygenase
MVTIHDAIITLFPSAKPLQDFVLVGNEIQRWNPALGPQPTEQELAAAEAATELRLIKQRITDIRYEKEIAGISIEGQVITSERDEVGHWYPRFANAYGILTSDPFALAATALAFPCGKAVPVEGGYKLSGKWPFCSGIDACTWILVGAMTEQNGGAPQRRFFLVPQANYKSLDNWETYGLSGTGSHEVVISDAFVPDHLSVSAEIFAAGQNLPGAKLYSNKLFQMPTFAAYAYVLSIVPLGTAKAAVEQFTANMRNRAGTYTGARIAELAPVQARIAEAAACVEFAESVIRRDWTDLENAVEKNEFPSMETKLRWKRNAAFATNLAVRSIDALMPAAGGGGLSLNSPLQRQFRDIHASSTHIALTWDIHAAAYGQSALGLQPQGGLLL